MRIALVGAEIEENLGLRYLASAVAARGHDPVIVPFDTADEIAAVAAAVARPEISVIGLSMMFQLRAREFVVLAERIRMLGWRGTLVAGGQHATFMADEILEDNPAFDAIVLGDGEGALCDLLAARSLLDVPGLAVRTETGAVRTACRSERTDLSTLPAPLRDAQPRLHLGLPTAPMIASRGCYASCSFCSIAAWEKLSGGPRYRVRPPEEVAREMAVLYWEKGVRVFNFHDDNFWFPKIEANRERLAALERALKAERVGDVALLFKCRPTDVDRDLFAQAKELGMVRIYVGIETDTPEGLITLRRGVAQPQNQRALDILGSLDVHALSNLLLFDPDTRLPDIAHNIGFIERNARHTLNFCRVEPYGGTPLTRRLASENRLIGDYLGFDYPLREPRVDLVWRMVHVIFHDRNFPSDGLANSIIGLAYRFHLAKRFWPSPELEALRAPVEDFIVRFNRDQVARMRAVLELGREIDLADHDRVGAFVEREAVAIRRADRILMAEHDALVVAIERLARGSSSGRLGEGAAGSGWWHVGASLLALSACKMNEPKQDQTTHETHGPDVASPTGPNCTPVTTAPDFVLKDADSDKLVHDALPKSHQDKPVENLKWTNGPAALQFSANYVGGGGQCNFTPPSFAGWHVHATLDHPDGYELVGIAGWPANTQNIQARGQKDEWLTFTIGNPGRTSHEHIGVIWRRKGDPNPLIVAAAVPPDPTPPPDPHPERQMHPGCDPVAEPVYMGPPLNTDRAVHISLMPGGGGFGKLEIGMWLDESVKGTVAAPPTVTSDFGTLGAVGKLDAYGATATSYAISLDVLCPDLHFIARTFTVKVDYAVVVGGIPTHLSAKAELEITPDGQIQQVQGKQGSLYPELPLGRRYGGVIEEHGSKLRASAPFGVETTRARWHGDGVTLLPTEDPLVVEARAQRDGASAVCVIDVPGGMCIATWKAS